MTGIRETNRAGGSLLDVSRLQELSSDNCNLLFVSDRTLYALEMYARNEINFNARYVAEYVGSDAYIPVLPSSSEFDFVRDVARNFRLEVQDMSCDVVAALNTLASVLMSNSCGCEVGQGSDTDDGVRNGSVPASIGDIVYQAPAGVADRDCKAANLVHFTLRDLFVELERYNVDDMGTLGLVLVVGTVSGIIASVVATPMIGIVVGVAGVVAAFVAKLIGVTVDLQNIVDAMDSAEEELICNLRSSGVASAAKAEYLASLETAGASSVEAALVGIMMTLGIMDVLYFDTPDLASFWVGYTPPVDCSTCAAFDRVEIIQGAEAGPSGVIIGSARFEIGDTVVVESIEELVICPGRHLIALNMISSGDLALHAEVDVLAGGWTDFCAHSGCITNDTFWSPELDFGVPVGEIACDVSPSGTYLDVSSLAPRSDSPITLTLERTS